MSSLPIAIRYFSKKQGGVALIISHLAPVFPKINVKQVTTALGYPDQIDGNTIPIGARIIAITEAWDTMITNQPYRSALSLDQAPGEIKKGAGTQFDPELAMLFISLVE